MFIINLKQTEKVFNLKMKDPNFENLFTVI